MRIKIPLLGSLLLLTALPTEAAILSVGQDELVETEGGVRVRTLIAFPNDIVDSGWFIDNDGGAGETQSSVGGIVGDGPGGQTGSGYDGSYSAYAKIVGADSLPQLGVYAKTVSLPDTSFDAYAEAHALQSYTYSGTESMQFTMRFNLDGIVGGDYLDYLSASILVGSQDYNPDDPFGELGPATVIDYLDLFTSGDNSENNVIVNETGFLNFMLDPGQTVWLDVTMTAIGQDGFDGGGSLIDALHTLSGSFTTGDSSLLTAGLQAPAQDPVAGVPEAATLAPFGLGLMGLALAARRRKSLSAMAA